MVMVCNLMCLMIDFMSIAESACWCVSIHDRMDSLRASVVEWDSVGDGIQRSNCPLDVVGSLVCIAHMKQCWDQGLCWHRGRGGVI